MVCSLLIGFGGDDGAEDVDAIVGSVGTTFFNAFSSCGVFGGVSDWIFEDVDDDDDDDRDVDDGGKGAGPFSFLII